MGSGRQIELLCNPGHARGKITGSCEVPVHSTHINYVARVEVAGLLTVINILAAITVHADRGGRQRER